MAFNATNPVTVGAATKKDHYDRVFDNTLLLKTSISTDGLEWNGLLRASVAGHTGIGSMAAGGAYNDSHYFRVGRRSGSSGDSVAAGTTEAAIFAVDGSITPNVDRNAFGMIVRATIVEFTSGTHALFGGAGFFAPVITAGAAALTEAATVYIDGAPSGAATNYALRVAAGLVSFGGFLAVGTSVVTSAGTGDVVIPFAKGFRTVNAAGTDTFPIVSTIAGAGISKTRGDGFTVANDATQSLFGAGACVGFIVVVCGSDDTAAIFMVAKVGGTFVTVLISDPDNKFSITAGTASRTNVYFTGGNCVVQNKLGSSKSYTASIIGN